MYWISVPWELPRHGYLCYPCQTKMRSLRTLVKSPLASLHVWFSMVFRKTGITVLYLNWRDPPWSTIFPQMLVHAKHFFWHWECFVTEITSYTDITMKSLYCYIERQGSASKIVASTFRTGTSCMETGQKIMYPCLSTNQEPVVSLPRGFPFISISKGREIIARKGNGLKSFSLPRQIGYPQRDNIDQNSFEQRPMYVDCANGQKIAIQIVQQKAWGLHGTSKHAIRNQAPEYIAMGNCYPSGDVVVSVTAVLGYKCLKAVMNEPCRTEWNSSEFVVDLSLHGTVKTTMAVVFGKKRGDRSMSGIVGGCVGPHVRGTTVCPQPRSHDNVVGQICPKRQQAVMSLKFRLDLLVVNLLWNGMRRWMSCAI